MSEARAALERGRRVVLVTPPAPEHAAVVWELLGQGGGGPSPRPGPATVIVGADRAGALDWAAAAPAAHRAHAVTSLGRVTRLIKEGVVDVVAGSLDDLTQLVARAALKLGAVETIVVAWPESLAAGASRQALDTLLAEAPEARRVILSWNPPALGDFLERHAFKAPVVGDLPLDDVARPLPPLGPARYTLAGPDARLTAIRGAISILDPKTAYVWTPTVALAERLGVDLESGERGAGLSVAAEVSGASFDLVICSRVPSRAQFAALGARGPVLLLLTPSQLPYARSIASPLTAVRLPGTSDRAADAAEALRRRIAARLEAGDVDAELLVLEPLFERYDPGEVAAALAALQRGAGSGEGFAPLAPLASAFVKLFVNVGKKDRVGPKDLVGALINEVGLKKEDIGRIELRDTFSTVEVAGGVAAEAAKGLSRVAIRNRKVQARLDRGGESVGPGRR